MNALTYHQTNGFKTSNRYSVVNTGNLIEMIKTNTGYEVAKYDESGVRKAEKLGFQKHLVRMRGNKISDELSPEIVIYNSYDKSSALKIYVGFFRFLCSNGLIVGDTINSFQTYHSSIDYDSLFAWCQNLNDKIESGTKLISRMKQTQMTRQLIEPVARKVLSIASPQNFNEETDWDHPESKWCVNMMLRPMRLQDRADDLWSQFNVIQERTFKGGTGLRKITNLAKTVKINRVLWDECSKLAA